MLNYVRSIKVSQRVFDLLGEKIENAEEEGYKITCYLNTFNNCREQGYYANVYGNEKTDYKDLFIWVHENRNSDNIVVRWQTEYPEGKGMFSEDTYRNRSKYFSYDEEHQAVDFIWDLIVEHLDLKI